MKQMMKPEDFKDLLDKELYLSKLRHKDLLLIQLYIQTQSFSKTAELLGMKKSTVYKRLNKPEIQKAMEYYKEILALRNNVSIDYFITQLKQIIENDKTKPADKIQALALLGRITGHIQDKLPDQNVNAVVLKIDNSAQEILKHFKD